MCGWADVGSCPPWVTSVTWVSLPGGGYLPWVPTVKYKGGLCCGYIGWALLWWRSIGRPGSKLGLFWCPVALPSSLCAGTHCAGACENGAGERQRSMPRVWVRRKSLGSTRHNQLPTLAHDTLPRHGVRHIAQPAHTVLGNVQGNTNTKSSGAELCPLVVTRWGPRRRSPRLRHRLNLRQTKSLEESAAQWDRTMRTAYPRVNHT